MEPQIISQLRKLAKDATTGEWVPFIGHKNVMAIGIKDKSVDQIIAWSGFDGCHEPKYKQKANCKFIAAANPQTVLHLLDELEALQNKLARIEGKGKNAE